MDKNETEQIKKTKDEEQEQVIYGPTAEVWNKAVVGGKYIILENEIEKRIKIKGWYFREVESFGKKHLELIAEVVEEDGDAVEKLFTTTSIRLKSKLRPIMECADSSEVIGLSIVKIGEKYQTNYLVKQF